MEKTFTEGLRFSLPTNAPDFIKGKLSFQVEEFIAFLKKHETNGGWVNVDLKVSKAGKPYAELNTWKPEKPEALKEEKTIDYPESNDEEIPF